GRSEPFASPDALPPVRRSALVAGRRRPALTPRHAPVDLGRRRSGGLVPPGGRWAAPGRVAGPSGGPAGGGRRFSGRSDIPYSGRPAGVDARRAGLADAAAGRGAGRSGGLAGVVVLSPVGRRRSPCYRSALRYALPGPRSRSGDRPAGGRPRNPRGLGEPGLV